jgi:hypothetical protein
MIISIVNHTKGKVSDEELQKAIRAINRQITEDFAPYWSMTATLRLEGRSAAQPDTAQVADMRGDAVIYLWDEADVDGAIGYHFQNNRGIPFGFVFTSIAEEIGEDWSVTLSHEALELLADPETNLLVIGPHPDPAEDREVFHWFEMADAVQAESYEVDHIKVSNFLLPLYFTGTRETDEVGARNDFLGRVHKGQTLGSFGINPGGYIGFFDPELGRHDTYSLQGDATARSRYEIKLQAKEARRAVRYRSPEVRAKLQREALAGRRVAAALARTPIAVCSLTEESAVMVGSDRHVPTKGTMVAKGSAGTKGGLVAKGAAGAKGPGARGASPAKGATPAKGTAPAKGTKLAKGAKLAKGVLAKGAGAGAARGGASRSGKSRGR